MNNKFLNFIIKKLIHFIILIVGVAIFSFILLQLSPIDPVNNYLQQVVVSDSQRHALEVYWGVGQPLTTKIFNWLINLFQGNFGISLMYRVPVIDVIIEKFSISFALMFVSWIFTGLFGFLLGIIAGKNKGNCIDKNIKTFCYILQSAPPFWTGLLVLIVFAISLGWFPIGLESPVGVLSNNITIWQKIAHLILPVFTLSLVSIAPIVLYTRNELVDILSSDYILFAKSRGEYGWSLIERHALRNILLPALTLQFLSFGQLFGGAILIEYIFSFPGLGQTAVNAGLSSDVPLFLSIVIFSAIFVFIGNSIADILYYFVDPRIKESDSFEST